MPPTLSLSDPTSPLMPVAAQFGAAIETIRPLGNGIINDTYLVTARSERFVLQRINRHVFARPDLILDNLHHLHRHLEQKSATPVAGNPVAENPVAATPVELRIPAIVPTRDQRAYYIDARHDYWRGLSYIADSLSLEVLTDPDQAHAVGLALGRFHTLFSDLDPAVLHDTLPGFHITPRYLDSYRRAVVRPAAAPDPFCRDFIAALAEHASILENARQTGALAARVIHGDPKLNNFLFCQKAERVIGLIDLDTVKAGLVHYDIGDCLRSCCHRETADTFDLTACEALLAGYLTEARHFFTDADYRLLYAAVELTPFELGLRFYTDHLQGNRYFKVQAPDQNLHRARAQFRLCRDIKAKKDAIEALIASLAAAPGR